MNNKQQKRQHGYYKKLAAIIKDFTEVVLVGPTNAKSNYLIFKTKSFCLTDKRLM
jgi:hypothetical protein